MSAFLVGATLFTLASTSAADQPPNLILNPEFQTSVANSGQPDDWTSNSWGSNTANFAYLSSGYNGSYSASTTVSNYASGDAKWIPNSVAVTPGSEYTYSDWYESNTTTNIWAQFTASDGSLSYQWLGTTGPSASWVQSTENLTVPSGISKISVFHVINSDGQLTIGDTSLTQVIPCNPTLVNGLSNGNFAQTCPNSPNIPAGWQTETYGSDPVTYGMNSDGYDGTSAVSIMTTSANDEAGWTTTVAAPLKSQRYQLSFWQAGDTYVYAYIIETLTDGTTQAVSLMSVPSTAGLFGTVTPSWSHYTDNFVTASNVQSMKIVLATSGQGTIDLSNVALTPLSNQIPPTFTKGIATITLDDNFSDQYTNGLSTMQSEGIKGTFYVTAGTLGTTGYMTDLQLKKVLADGDEIASHLYHLSDMIELDDPTLISEMTGNNFALTTLLGSKNSPTDFASPYGSYLSNETPLVMQYYTSDRTTDGEVNTKANLNVGQIHARLVKPTTSLATIQSWIAEAQANNEWLVLVYHGITTSPSSDEEAQFAITPTQFKQQMQAIKSSGITVVPVNSALNYLLPQEKN